MGASVRDWASLILGTGALLTLGCGGDGSRPDGGTAPTGVTLTGATNVTGADETGASGDDDVGEDDGNPILDRNLGPS